VEVCLSQKLARAEALLAVEDHLRPMQHLQGCTLLCGECSIAAVSGAGGVGAHNPEMICRARTQARDVRTDILVIIPGLDLVGRSEAVAGGSSILKVHGGVKSVGIYAAVERG
jgi:hypothetical protein